MNLTKHPCYRSQMLDIMDRPAIRPRARVKNGLQISCPRVGQKFYDPLGGRSTTRPAFSPPQRNRCRMQATPTPYLPSGWVSTRRTAPRTATHGVATHEKGPL